MIYVSYAKGILNIFIYFYTPFANYFLSHDCLMDYLKDISLLKSPKYLQSVCHCLLHSV